jgi:hypothetical protein
LTTRKQRLRTTDPEAGKFKSIAEKAVAALSLQFPPFTPFCPRISTHICGWYLRYLRKLRYQFKPYIASLNFHLSNKNKNYITLDLKL